MRKLTCNIGDRFSDWTVIDQTFVKNGHTYVKAKCKCGAEEELNLGDLIKERAHSCRHCAAQKRGHINEIHIGDKIKHWIVVDGPRIYHNTVQFKVQCDCGQGSRWIQCNELLNSNKCFSCQKCAHNNDQNILMQNQFGKIKRSAIARNITFTVSKKYLQELWDKQNHICSITGDNIINIRKASLDRIDSTKGYEEGNVQWVTYRANVSKHTMSMDELYDFCRKVLNHANQQPSISSTTDEGSETNSWN